MGRLCGVPMWSRSARRAVPILVAVLVAFAGPLVAATETATTTSPAPSEQQVQQHPGGSVRGSARTSPVKALPDQGNPTKFDEPVDQTNHATQTSATKQDAPSSTSTAPTTTAATGDGGRESGTTGTTGAAGSSPEELTGFPPGVGVRAMGPAPHIEHGRAPQSAAFTTPATADASVVTSDPTVVVYDLRAHTQVRLTLTEAALRAVEDNHNLDSPVRPGDASRPATTQHSTADTVPSPTTSAQTQGESHGDTSASTSTGAATSVPATDGSLSPVSSHSTTRSGPMTRRRRAERSGSRTTSSTSPDTQAPGTTAGTSSTTSSSDEEPQQQQQQPQEHPDEPTTPPSSKRQPNPSTKATVPPAVFAELRDLLGSQGFPAIGPARHHVEHPTQFPYSAIGHLGLFPCTGSYVSRRMVLTAAHCLHELEHPWWKDDLQFRFSPGADSGPGGLRMQTDARYVVVSGAYYDYAHANPGQPRALGHVWDWGLIIFDGDSDPRAGSLGFRVATEAQGNFLNVGYPTDVPHVGQMFADECTVTFPTTRAPASAHDCESWNGNSGGPFVDQEQNKIVAISRNMPPEAERVGTSTLPNEATRVATDIYNWLLIFKQHFG